MLRRIGEGESVRDAKRDKRATPSNFMRAIGKVYQTPRDFLPASLVEWRKVTSHGDTFGRFVRKPQREASASRV
jgi:hypothetical protein